MDENNYYTLPKIHYLPSIYDFTLDFLENKEVPIFNNESLYTYLCDTKERISNNMEVWDALKKITNPYEYVYTNYNSHRSISLVKPISRAYFKLIEIVHTFGLFDKYKDTRSHTNPDTTPDIHTFHLAEGPGGFIQATQHIRNHKNDTYHGITLIDKKNTSIPSWSKSEWFLKKNDNIVLEYGVTEDGNLYHPDNYKNLCDKYGNTMDFLTADGGFDFSTHYDKQEEEACRLILTEVLYIVSLQKEGGSCVLKIFDVFTKPTHEILLLLCCFYEDVHIYKPYTSRIGNSEKYVVCRGFRVKSTVYLYETFLSIIKKLNEYIRSQENGEGEGEGEENPEKQEKQEKQEKNKIYIASFLNIPIHHIFKTSICEINSIYGQQQIENINYTFNISSNTHRKKEKMDMLKKENIQKCVLWCEKYNIPHTSHTKGNIFL